MKELLKSSSMIELKMKKEYLSQCGIHSVILLDGKAIQDMPKTVKTVATVYELPYDASLMVDDSSYCEAVNALGALNEAETLPDEELLDKHGRTPERIKQDRRKAERLAAWIAFVVIVAIIIMIQFI